MAGPAYSASDLLHLYTERGPHIFSRSRWHRAAGVGNLFEEKFPADELEAVLDEYFGDTMLSEALTDVIVPAYEIESRAAWFFKSRNARDDATRDYPMKSVARATSAAPTYFEPARIHTQAEPGYWSMVDGGVFANNPAMCCVAEALKVYERPTLAVLSLGTGSQIREVEYKKAKDWGVIGWARPILDVVFDGVNDTVDYQLKQICSSTKQLDRYLRLQTTLDVAKDEMDDASEHNVHQLKLLGMRIVEEYGTEIDEFVTALEASPSKGKHLVKARA